MKTCTDFRFGFCRVLTTAPRFCNSCAHRGVVLTATPSSRNLGYGFGSMSVTSLPTCQRSSRLLCASAFRWGSTFTARSAVVPVTAIGGTVKGYPEPLNTMASLAGFCFFEKVKTDPANAMFPDCRAKLRFSALSRVPLMSTPAQGRIMFSLADVNLPVCCVFDAINGKHNTHILTERNERNVTP